MKKLLLGLYLVSTGVSAGHYHWNVTKIIDGDTFAIELNELPEELSKVSVRLNGADTPETHQPKCPHEKALGIKATEYVRTVIEQAQKEGNLQFENVSWDKYGSRIDADVFIGDRNLADMLIEQRLAVPYHGEKKTVDWCNWK